jgi:16S rRNA (guanine966-N2)-methyltransferase
MRILAGLHKGRKLLSPPAGSVTRPITGSVKKSLFDMLGARLEAASVLDLYSGTGTMGLEAMSRGARRCWFAESDRSVVDRLRRNIDAIGAAERCAIWRGDVTARLGGWLGEVDAPIDVAFVDPPYAHARNWDWRRFQQAVLTPLAGSLAEDGIVVLRLPGDAELPEELDALSLRRLRRYGDMILALLGRKEE